MKSCPQDGLIRTLVDGLVQRRLELGLSQRDIAQRLFLTHSCVSLFENHRRVPLLSTVFRYAEVVGVNITLEAKR